MAGASELRIYCICGQKMRVSESMFGHPGKCVACRQKIRIPRPEEVSDEGGEIYLKDHPEFLRKSRIRRKRKPATPANEVEPAARPEEVSKKPAPIDILPPLRALASIEAKLQRQLESLSRYETEKGPASVETERADLMGRQTRVLAARAELDDQLRQRQVEVNIELANVQEKIVAVELAVRVGELEFSAYRAEAERLRALRDRLERRRQNLRGWLEVRDPYQAGGYLEVSEVELPKWTGSLVLPDEAQRAQSRLNIHVDALRRALTERELSERKLVEARRLKSAMPDASPAIEEARLTSAASKQRAEAAARFFRGRLEQLDKDCVNDLDAVHAQIDLARGRLQVNEIGRPQFSSIERALLRAKADTMKARDVVARALAAGSARDVPYPHGTFLQRLARPVAEEGLGVDSYILMAVSVLLLVSVFVPLFGRYSPIVALRDVSGQTATVLWVIALPVVTAFAAFLVGFNRAREIRGLLACALLILATGLSAATLRELALYDAGPLGTRLREAGLWLPRPSVILGILAAAGMACAATVALMRERRLRRVLYGTVALLGVVCVLILTDGLFLLRADPEVQVADEYNQRLGNYSVTVDVRNAGTRRLYLTHLPPSQLANPARTVFSVSLERQVGPNSFADVPPAEEALGEIEDNVVRPGQTRSLIYRGLVPGGYRFLIESPLPGVSRTESFELAEPTPTAPGEADEATRKTPAVEHGAGDSSVQEALLGVKAELSGIITAPDREPRFSVNIHMPDGTVQTRKLGIADDVYQRWKVAEYNPTEQTLTLSNETRLLILRRGERHSLTQ